MGCAFNKMQTKHFMQVKRRSRTVASAGVTITLTEQRKKEKKKRDGSLFVPRCFSLRSTTQSLIK